MSAPWSLFLDKPSWSERALRLAGVLALLLACVAFAQSAGGADSSYTYFTLLPILLAATWFGLPGGLISGVLGGLLLGPVAPGILGESQQAIQEWAPRFVVFTLTGVVAGSLHARLWQQARSAIQVARQDPQTGLPNRFALMRDLEAGLAHHTEPSDLSVLLLRAMDFEDVIDVLGIHHADVAIRQLADRIDNKIRLKRRAYLFGGSQLGLIVDTKDTRELKRIAQTVHDAASAPFDVEGVPVRIQPAIGVGHTGDDTRATAEELVRRSRVALRYSELRGRDWVSYEPMLDMSQSGTMTLIAQVEEALEASEFQLHYQPKIRLADGQFAGVEALIRWYRLADGEAVAPGDYMPKLEKTNLIDDLSAFVIRAATAYARDQPHVPISINLAMRNLSNETLIEALIASVRQANLPPEHFEVEITESSLMRQPAETLALLHRLRNSAIGVSVDDFGTGYSSFAYLRSIPATNFKIDRAFVQPLASDDRARRLVYAMIEMGHALNLTVTAEGVETEQQAAILRDAGCDYGQGFFWSPALPPDALNQWLERTT